MCSALADRKKKQMHRMLCWIHGTPKTQFLVSHQVKFKKICENFNSVSFFTLN